MAAKIDEKAEKLPLAEAIQVLRVCDRSVTPDAHSILTSLQAVEVASPNAIYELCIKTEVGNGIAVPKGRVSLPREAKPSKEEKILVFAEGKQADEARKAGADVVGGPELIDAVSLLGIMPSKVC